MKIWEKIKDWFRKDKDFDTIIKEKKFVENYGRITASLLSFSDSSYLTSMAARICIGKEVEEDYSKRLEHITRVLDRGHESTIGHSSIIILIEMDSTFSQSFTEVSNALKFTDFVSIPQEDKSIVVLIGGSIRAYKYFFREVRDLSNPICNVIKETLYQAAESEFFGDFIKDGIMEEDRFKFKPIFSTEDVSEEVMGEDGKPYMETFCSTKFTPRLELKGEICDIVYSDDPLSILDKVSHYGFTLRDVLKVSSCSILLHDISRIISQQFTRHNAAGISQESQRYVNYSNSNFIDPTKFNEKYDTSQNYSINIGGAIFSMTTSELGSMLINIYPQLIEQGMLKQDSRGYLIQNADTKLLMTFTFSNLIHFIKERKDKAAQPEAQYVTEHIIDRLYNFDKTTFLFTTNGIDPLIKVCETAIYKTKEEDILKQDDCIDEVMSEEEF